MSVEINDRLKLRPSVAVVSNGDVTEFFLSDIRHSIALRMQKEVTQLLFGLDGTMTVGEFLEANNLGSQNEEVMPLLDFLNKNCVLIKVDMIYSEDYDKFPRVYSLLENYCPTQQQVEEHFQMVRKSRVMIIGLGSVGTWVAQSLLMSGVRHFLFVDGDRVELSNLHRQCGLTEASIGQLKTDAFSSRLKEMDAEVEVDCIVDWLDEAFFERHDIGHIDLIINCADKPTVDETSMIVGKYAMPHGMPHIVGGGYNLHQSLIGQVVIPGKTACLECFRMNLDDLNEIDTSNIRKLENKNRRVGSFPPLSALSSAITANEAFKVLAGLDNLTMAGQRTEFLLRELNFANVDMPRRHDCKWCGYEGKYYQLQRDKN